MSTSKFTCDVQHGTFCEDTSKSRLIGKETTRYTWREKQTEAESSSRKDKEDGEKAEAGRERVTEPEAHKQLKASTTVSLL